MFQKYHEARIQSKRYRVKVEFLEVYLNGALWWVSFLLWITTALLRKSVFSSKYVHIALLDHRNIWMLYLILFMYADTINLLYNVFYTKAKWNCRTLLACTPVKLVFKTFCPYFSYFKRYTNVIKFLFYYSV